MLHYTDCGLRNVWLRNGYVERDTPYGRALAIQDVEGLHRAIGRFLVGDKPGLLSGEEVRFLRKELDLSQARLAEIMGFDPQSVAKWEKNGAPKWADRMLRAIYREHADGNAAIVAMVERLQLAEGATTERLELEESGSGWHPVAA